jgi:hypothetical protein
MAAARANWKGYLRLSLVSCPIALFPATSSFPPRARARTALRSACRPVGELERPSYGRMGADLLHYHQER